ncbi:MAG: Gfo/Idh/MocA family oxidoreductase [Bryobacteraceae bacterium]
MDRVRIGVIGLGRFGEMHCQALAGIPEVEIAGLCTRDPDRLAAFSARYPAARAFHNYRDLLASGACDAVSIVTMWRQHAEVAIAALDAGLHVFVEKPMASTNEGCAAMIAARNRSGKFGMVGQICRFNPRYAAARREIAAVGRIVSLYARRNIPAAVSAQVLPKIGPIAGDAVHDTDLMLWFTGKRIVSAFAQTHSVRGLANPDLAWTLYRFEDGAIGVIENIWFLPEGTPYRIDERMEIVGTEGVITIQESGPGISVSGKDGWRAPDTTYWPLVGGGLRGGALRDELAYFARCVLDGRAPAVTTFEESAGAVRACLAAEESARENRPIEIRPH